MHARGECASARLLGAGALLVAGAALPAAGQGTTRESVDSSETQGDSPSADAAISPSGRYVAFRSRAANLVFGDGSGIEDVFVRDRVLGTTERVSVDPGGASGDQDSGGGGLSISADGRYVAFWSFATNLVAGDTNGTYDIFVRDRLLGTTERVSVHSSGLQSNGGSFSASISADGRYVAFYSLATNLVTGDTNAVSDVFVRDRQAGTTARVSLDSTGTQGNDTSDYPVISGDGRFVAFSSLATNLVGGDTNGHRDAFVRDRQLGSTSRVSVDTLEAQADLGGGSASITDDGRYVVILSSATNLVAGDTNGTHDVFVRDLALGNTERVSVDSLGAQANGQSLVASPLLSCISADGRYVAFHSVATNLVTGDTNGVSDVFVRDRLTGTTQRISVSSVGAQANGQSMNPSISADGQHVAFWSDATDLVAPDTNLSSDVFVRDFVAGPTYGPFCFPDIGGVRSCPCGNPATAADLGCDSFTSAGATSGTGGAKLTASGSPNASGANTFVFHVTQAHNPGSNTNLHVFWKGTSALSVGVKSGFGVRCVAGSLKRIYQGTGTGTGGLGSTNAVDFPNGTQTTDAWTASLMPAAGTTLYYYDSFRDQQGPTSCNTGNDRFNVSHGLSVTWVP